MWFSKLLQNYVRPLKEFENQHWDEFIILTIYNCHTFKFPLFGILFSILLSTLSFKDLYRFSKLPIKDLENCDYFEQTKKINIVGIMENRNYILSNRSLSN